MDQPGSGDRGCAGDGADRFDRRPRTRVRGRGRRRGVLADGARGTRPRRGLVPDLVRAPDGCQRHGARRGIAAPADHRLGDDRGRVRDRRGGGHWFPARRPSAGRRRTRRRLLVAGASGGTGAGQRPPGPALARRSRPARAGRRHRGLRPAAGYDQSHRRGRPARPAAQLALADQPEHSSLLLWRNLRGWPEAGPYRSIGIEPMLGRAADWQTADDDELARIGSAGRVGWTLRLEALTCADPSPSSAFLS